MYWSRPLTHSLDYYEVPREARLGTDMGRGFRRPEGQLLPGLCERIEWDPREEPAIRNAWSKKTAKSYAHITCRARKSAQRPKFILDDVWQEWVPRWEEPKWKDMSEKMKANRGKASTHTGGSCSFANHADDLKLKLKVDDVPAHTLFQHNHSVRHDTTTWVLAKAFTVEKAYQRELETEKAKGANIDENALYYKDVGGRKRDEVYGTRATKEYYYDSSSGSSVCSGSRHMKSMYIEVDELGETVKLEQAERLKMKSEMEQYKGLHEQIVAAMASGSLANLMTPPNYAPAQPQQEEEEEESESGSE